MSKLSRITGVISNGQLNLKFKFNKGSTIKSSDLFNIANSYLLHLFDLNENDEKDSVQKYAVAFADDLTVIVVSKDIKKINETLTDILTKFNKIILKLTNIEPYII